MTSNVKLSAGEGVMPYLTLVGKVIEAARIKKQLTQADLASELNIGQSAYSRLEAGQAAMSLTQLRKISGVIGESPSSILASADAWANELQKRGVTVPEDKPDNKAALLIGLGLLLALMTKG